MRNIASIAMLALLGACTEQGLRTATVNDVAAGPSQNTAVIGPGPRNAGTLVIKAVGGQLTPCAEAPGGQPCQRVRVAPGTTILRLDFFPADRRRFAPATDIDLPVTVQAGHTYHLVATIERGPASGRGGTRVVVEAIDVGRR